MLTENRKIAPGITSSEQHAGLRHRFVILVTLEIWRFDYSFRFFWCSETLAGYIATSIHILAVLKFKLNLEK